LSGFFLGSLFGGIAATVLAPATGEETRDLLGSRAREYGGRAKEAAGATYERGKKVIGGARTHLDEAIAAGKTAAQGERVQLETEKAPIEE
jgi:gas vesicle protein